MQKTQIVLDPLSGGLVTRNMPLSSKQLSVIDSSGTTHSGFEGTPGATEDQDAGYSVKDKIYNNAGEAYTCIDDTPGNAQWVSTSLAIGDLGALASKDSLAHSELDLDDGTNPHGINPDDLGLGYLIDGGSPDTTYPVG